MINSMVIKLTKLFFTQNIYINKGGKENIISKDIKALVFDPYFFTFCGRKIVLDENRKKITFEYTENAILKTFNFQKAIEQIASKMGFKACFRAFLDLKHKKSQIKESLLAGRSYSQIAIDYKTGSDLIKKIKNSIKAHDIKISIYKKRLLRVIDILIEDGVDKEITKEPVIKPETIEKIREDLKNILT